MPPITGHAHDCDENTRQRVPFEADGDHRVSKLFGDQKINDCTLDDGAMLALFPDGTALFTDTVHSTATWGNDGWWQRWDLKDANGDVVSYIPEDGNWLNPQGSTDHLGGGNRHAVSMPHTFDKANYQSIAMQTGMVAVNREPRRQGVGAL